MNKYINEEGLTLVELLASIILLFLISLFIFNIVYSSTTQNQAQTDESTQINSAAVLLKQFTKDIRKSNNFDTLDYTIEDQNGETITYRYDVNDDILYRNNSILVNNVETFLIWYVNSDTLGIAFTINGKYYDTKISLRKGNN